MDPLNFPRSGVYNTVTADILSNLSISSRDGIFATDTASKFTVLINPLIVPRTVQLLECAITVNNFNLRDPITLEENGFPPVNVTLPAGIYNDANIAAALQTALNTASPAGNVYTVTVDSTNYTLTITAVGVTWRFINISVQNNTYYALGACTSVTPPLAPFSLSKVLGSYDFRPYDVLFLRIQEFSQTNIDSVQGYPGSTFVLTCQSVNSGGVATYSANSYDNQFWVNTQNVTLSQLSIQVTDKRGTVIPLRCGSTNILFGFNRITNKTW